MLLNVSTGTMQRGGLGDCLDFRTGCAGQRQALVHPGVNGWGVAAWVPELCFTLATPLLACPAPQSRSHLPFPHCSCPQPQHQPCLHQRWRLCRRTPAASGGPRAPQPAKPHRVQLRSEQCLLGQ